MLQSKVKLIIHLQHHIYFEVWTYKNPTRMLKGIEMGDFLYFLVNSQHAYYDNHVVGKTPITTICECATTCSQNSKCLSGSKRCLVHGSPPKWDELPWIISRTSDQAPKLHQAGNFCSLNIQKHPRWVNSQIFPRNLF